ncbi:uncharacterized protein METZ01_LOCUS165641, partial [marine metagenome]
SSRNDPNHWHGRHHDCKRRTRIYHCRRYGRASGHGQLRESQPLAEATGGPQRISLSSQHRTGTGPGWNTRTNRNSSMEQLL